MPKGAVRACSALTRVTRAISMAAPCASSRRPTSVTPGAEKRGGSPCGAGRDQAGWGEASTEMMGRAAWEGRSDLKPASECGCEWPELEELEEVPARRGGAAATPFQTVPVMTRRLFTQIHFDPSHDFDLSRAQSGRRTTTAAGHSRIRLIRRIDELTLTRKRPCRRPQQASEKTLSKLRS